MHLAQLRSKFFLSKRSKLITLSRKLMSLSEKLNSLERDLLKHVLTIQKLSITRLLIKPMEQLLHTIMKWSLLNKKLNLLTILKHYLSFINQPTRSLKIVEMNWFHWNTCGIWSHLLNSYSHLGDQLFGIRLIQTACLLRSKKCKRDRQIL